jgi:hypothetical protein
MRTYVEGVLLTAAVLVVCVGCTKTPPSTPVTPAVGDPAKSADKSPAGVGPIQRPTVPPP